MPNSKMIHNNHWHSWFCFRFPQIAPFLNQGSTGAKNLGQIRDFLPLQNLQEGWRSVRVHISK